MDTRKKTALAVALASVIVAMSLGGCASEPKVVYVDRPVPAPAPAPEPKEKKLDPATEQLVDDAVGLITPIPIANRNAAGCEAELNEALKYRDIAEAPSRACATWNKSKRRLDRHIED